MMSNEALIGFNDATEETQHIPPVLIDTDTAIILNLMGTQSNPQLKLKLKHVPTRKYTMIDVDVTLEQDAFLV